MYVHLQVKYPLFLPDVNETCIFTTDFRKVHLYQNSWKSVEWVVGLLRAHGRTERQAGRTNLIVAFAILRTRLILDPYEKPFLRNETEISIGISNQ